MSGIDFYLSILTYVQNLVLFIKFDKIISIGESTNHRNKVALQHPKKNKKKLECELWM